VSDLVTVLIASPLEDEQVARITAFSPSRVRVIHEPELLATPQYEGQHMGVPQLDAAQRARWDALVAQAEVMFDFDAFDGTLATRAPRLRWLQGTSSGIGERLRRSGLLETRVRFTTAAGVHDTALAEFVVLGLLTFTKDVAGMRAHQADHRWARATTRSLAGTRALVVGLGAVGGEVVRVLDALGVEVWGLRRSGSGSAGAVRRIVARDDLLDTLPQVHSLVLACPLTPETHHLIGARELAALRPAAIVVNVARGQVIDEPALVQALSEGRLAGAALDVFEKEPLPPDSPLWALPNVLVSPHSASTIAGENARIVDIFLENLGRYLDGSPLCNEFDRERGY
jgi:phosphoglycerate dehydrogenase-like enzyme